MSSLSKLLFFSDLDGTLLDHESYSWAAAKPALDKLRDQQIGLILASSKTASEIEVIRREVGFESWPAIVENGCGLLASRDSDKPEQSVYAELRAAISELPTGFRGFGDMTAKEVSERTGLSPENAERAKERQFSEPGIWMGSERAFEGFGAVANACGLTLQRGGRFISLSFGGTKADRMAELMERFRPQKAVALGDAPNDLDMLRLADIGVLVRNPSTASLSELAEEPCSHLIRTHKNGPEGWNEAVLEILDDVSMKGDAASNV